MSKNIYPNLKSNLTTLLRTLSDREENAIIEIMRNKSNENYIK